MKRIHIPVLLFSLIMGQAALAGQVYKWTDSKGVTHFSDTPPPEKANSKEVLSLPDIKAPAPEPQYSDSTQVAQAQSSATSLLDSPKDQDVPETENMANTTPPATKSELAEDKHNTTKQSVEADKKIALKIISLQDDQTIRSNRGFITVQVDLNKKLEIGQSLQLMMDTQPYGAPQTPPLWELKNIDRGSHTFLVNVVESGKVIASSNTITVHLHRTTVK
ncbi:DUF4124 domain-containing protein [Vibrio algivorus]|uniref:DUF4124 domain-containing protein n=1 Tax=Vibrio algivorus TaxID=1667024 RepID=A0A557PC57_9VIBR|nr:DUF4124 domain-containing protein [Vibrio algivorus]TVO38245.1 DUF4124 domain-containing protein [Vibrio algivorus]